MAPDCGSGLGGALSTGKVSKNILLYIYITGMSRDVSFNRFGVLSRRSPSSDASMEEQERLEPNRYLDTMVEWQKEKYKLYRQRTLLPKFRETEPEDRNSREHKWWKFQKDLNDRNLTTDDYEWLKDNFNRHGLHVR